MPLTVDIRQRCLLDKLYSLDNDHCAKQKYDHSDYGAQHYNKPRLSEYIVCQIMIYRMSADANRITKKVINGNEINRGKHLVDAKAHRICVTGLPCVFLIQFIGVRIQSKRHRFAVDPDADACRSCDAHRISDTGC